MHNCSQADKNSQVCNSTPYNPIKHIKQNQSTFCASNVWCCSSKIINPFKKIQKWFRFLPWPPTPINENPTNLFSQSALVRVKIQNDWQNFLTERSKKRRSGRLETNSHSNQTNTESIIESSVKKVMHHSLVIRINHTNIAQKPEQQTASSFSSRRHSLMIILETNRP